MAVDIDAGAILTARSLLVRAWMLLADGKTSTAQRMFADMPAGFWAKFGLAEATLAEGQPGAAALLFAEAELRWREKDLALRAPAIARRAFCLARSGEPEYAAYLCESTLAEVNDPVAVLWLCCAGVTCWNGPRRTVAAKRALAIAEAIDFRRAADLYHLLAETERKAGHPEEAIAALDRSVELLARTRLNPGLGLCHLVRAQELGDQGAIAEAIDHAQRAMGVCGDEALCELADLYRRARRFDEAQRFAQQAHDDALGQRAGDNARRGRAVRVLGQIAADSSSVWKSSRTSPARVPQPLPSLTPIVQTSLEQTSLERAEELLRSSADLYARAGDALEVAETLRILGRFLAGHGRVPEAISCFDQACATVLAPRGPRS